MPTHPSSMSSSSSKILITGTAGFIGFHLANALLERGDEVVGIDNINDYYDVNLKYARLAEAGIARDDIDWGKVAKSTKYEKYRFIRMNLEDREELMDLCAREKFDVIVNLAAQAGVRYSIENPHAYIQSNVIGFVNILEAARHNTIKHLVYASSSSVYGMNKEIPFSTEHNVDHPVSLYAATKKSNELMAHTYSHLYGVPTTGLRFFTVYGPWGRPDMAYFLFAEAIRKGEPIKVFNNGKMMRDFTYIDDIIFGVVKTIETIPKTNPQDDNTFPDRGKAPYRVFNIGNNKPVNLFDFIEVLENQMGKKAEKIMMPMQDGDVERTWANVEDLYLSIGEKIPSTEIESGMKLFSDWYKLHYTS